MTFDVGRIATPFWDYVNIAGDDKCWLWTGGKNNSGYGTYWYAEAGKVCVAHRIAYLLSFGEIEPLAPTDFNSNQFVLHSCDTRLCCNPSHLHLGTYSDNQKEAYARGRRAQPKGSNHVNSKLTPEQVVAIREGYFKDKIRQVDLAARYSVSQRAISLIVRGETYK